MKTSVRSSVCGSGTSVPGAAVSRQVHTSPEPRLGAASAVNSIPGTSKRGASAARMTVMVPPR
ncbi:MAG TPA: hypothetical protein VGJ44_17985 [Kribbellaceae bacterium]